MSIFALAYTDKIEPYFEHAMSSVIDSYATSNATRDGFNFIQSDLQVIGLKLNHVSNKITTFSTIE